MRKVWLSHSFMLLIKTKNDEFILLIITKYYLLTIDILQNIEIYIIKNDKKH